MVTVGDKIIVVFRREQILQSSHTQILLWCWVDFLFFPFKVYIFKKPENWYQLNVKQMNAVSSGLQVSPRVISFCFFKNYTSKSTFEYNQLDSFIRLENARFWAH